MIKDLIESLCVPGALHPLGIKKVIETHISYVLLDGNYAYKIKKPVNLGFVNFASLGKRKFYCEEEIRLNKRMAPDLYIGTISITGTVSEPEIDGGGPILEYAVKMIQFPRENELSNLLGSAVNLSVLFHTFCIELASFHKTIAVAGSSSKFSDSERISSPNIQNFRSIDSALLAPKESKILKRLKQWTLNSLEKNNDAFIKRQADGRIRECHGDLHLGNLVCIDSRIVAFDCLEFNEQLRWVDVASELAFLVMDLFANNKPELARGCLDWYLEESGDYDLIPLFQHYLVYRAMVRAKVSFLSGLKSKKENNQKAFSQYLHLADRLASPKPKPKLIITHGFSGCGKTWISNKIVTQTDCIRVRSDVIRKHLHGLGVRDLSSRKNSEPIYTIESDLITYSHLQEIALKILTAGYPVLIDATFLSKENRKSFRLLSESIDVDFCILDLQADISVLKSRITKRQQSGNDASEAGIKVLENQLKSANPLDQFEQQQAIVLNTDKDFVDVKTLIKELKLDTL